jgi:hypothetical protein
MKSRTFDLTIIVRLGAPKDYEGIINTALKKQVCHAVLARHTATAGV